MKTKKSGNKEMNEAKEVTLIEEFWVSDKCQVIEEKYSFIDNPPKEDTSEFLTGYLRGRVVYIGNALQIVVYGKDSIERLFLFRRHWPRILCYLKEVKRVSQEILNDAVFVDEKGQKVKF